MFYSLQPCLPDYNNMDEDKEGQYHVDCLSINLVRTMFAWEYSLDGEQFHLITATTKITSVNSKTLDPIYFRSGMFVRCSCQPVSRDGIYGHPRISGMVRLESSEWCSKDSSQDDRVRVQLSSYDSFGARNEVTLNANSHLLIVQWYDKLMSRSLTSQVCSVNSLCISLMYRIF